MKWLVSVGVLAAAALAAVQAGPAATQACVANASWKEDCNDCICSEAGQPMCTRRVCPGPTPLPAGECTPGTVWRQSCNSCRCTATGRSICTQMACLNDGNGLPTVELPQPLPMPDHTRPTGHLCREGHTWKQDCNTCRCVGGRTACTMMACLALSASGAGSGLEEPSLVPAHTGHTGHQTPSVLPAPIGQESPSVLPAPLPLRLESARLLPAPIGLDSDCTPGETWRDDCNVCRCLPSRQAACTMARCVAKRAVAAAGKTERHPCTVGDVWKEDCNTCRCTPGGVAACTKIGCVKLDQLAEAGTGDSGARAARAAQ